MTKSLRGALLGVLAIGTLAAFATGAAGEEVLLRPAGRITLIGSLTISSEAFEVSCNMTMPGTLASSFQTVQGAHMGSLEPIIYRECRGGTGIRILEETTRIELYQVLRSGEAILGFLQRHRFGILIETGLLLCLYGGLLEALIEAEGNLLRHVTVLRGSGFRLIQRLGALLECPRVAIGIGSLTLAPTQTFTGI
jgi:hypothetical protein